MLFARPDRRFEAWLRERYGKNIRVYGSREHAHGQDTSRRNVEAAQ
jgi:hypothetical protein